MIPIDIPGKYYPSLMYVLCCLFEGPKLSYVVAIGVGYLYQRGHLNCLRPSSAMLGDLESATGIMFPISRRKGWVKTVAATGFDKSMMVDDCSSAGEDIANAIHV